MTAMIALLMTVSACRFCQDDVSCEYDRDCIPDVLPYCTTTDGGVGVCTDDERYEGDYVDPLDRFNNVIDGGTLGAE